MSTANEQQATLDDDLNAAWDAVEPDEETEHETQAASEETEAPQTESAPDDDQVGDEAASLDEDADTTDDEEASETAESEESASQPTVEPPQDWPKDWTEKFAKLPDDESRQLLIDQYKSFQADYTRKTQDLAEVRKAIDPIRDQLALNGMSEGQYIRQLTAADKYIAQNPVEGITWLMQNYGISVDQLRGGGEADSDEWADPEVSQLKQQVNQLQNQLQQQDQQTQYSQQAQLQQHIQQFASETDESGQPKRPHFEEVKQDMAGLLTAGMAQSLDEAYDQAVWARSDLREKMLEQQRQASAQEAEKQRKQKVQRAKQASTPASSGATAEAKEPARDLRSELEKAFDEFTT